MEVEDFWWHSRKDDLLQTQTSDSTSQQRKELLMGEGCKMDVSFTDFIWKLLEWWGWKMLLYGTNTRAKSNATLYELHKTVYPSKWVLTVPIIWAEVTQASDVRWCLWFLHCLKISQWDWRLDKMAYRLTFGLQSREVYFSSCKLVGKNFEDSALERWGHIFAPKHTHFFMGPFHLLLPSYMTSSRAALWHLRLMEIWSEQFHILPFPWLHARTHARTLTPSFRLSALELIHTHQVLTEKKPSCSSVTSAP